MRKPRTCSRLNIDSFSEKYGRVLGNNLTELCKIAMLKNKFKKPRYTKLQKYLASNIMVGAFKSGYKFISSLIPLPSTETVMKGLRQLKTKPGISKKGASILKVKVNAKSDKEKMCFLLLDEMSLRKGLALDQPSGTIYGFVDDGKKRTKDIASSALVVMAVGITKKWKYPLGYYFTGKVMPSSNIALVVKEAINAMEEEGFIVVGLTTDQGSNFECAFKLLGASPTSPKISHRGKSYYVFKDPPHLIKNARNFLEKGNVVVPGGFGIAKWDHIRQLYYRDCESSFKLAPRISKRHIEGLRFANKMKVNLAVKVMSNSVSAALDYLSACGEIDISSLATSSYLKKFNDLFDVLNSSHHRDPVKLRRPIKFESSGYNLLKESLNWLKELEELNSNRRVSFIKGWIQSITVILDLTERLGEYDLNFLNTRHICQDPLELFFGKIRNKGKFPHPYQFSSQYVKVASESLVKAPTTGNCTNERILSREISYPCDERVVDTISLLELTSPEESPSVFQIEESEVAEALNFSSVTSVGGVKEEAASINAAAYFAGYLVKRLNDSHMKHFKKSLSDCAGCCNILSRSQDWNYHLFTSFKEYEHNDNLSSS